MKVSAAISILLVAATGANAARLGEETRRVPDAKAEKDSMDKSVKSSKSTTSTKSSKSNNTSSPTSDSLTGPPPQIGYMTYYANDGECKNNVAITYPFLNGVPFDNPQLGDKATTENCFENVACQINTNSSQCIDAGGGTDMPLDTYTAFIGPPDDENGCQIYFDEGYNNTIPACDCFKSTAFPGCYVKFISANDFDKIVDTGSSSKSSKNSFKAKKKDSSTSAVYVKGEKQ